jgi:hypothetical protein
MFWKKKKPLVLDIETTTDHKTIRLIGVKRDLVSYTYDSKLPPDFQEWFNPDFYYLVTWNGQRFDLPLLDEHDKYGHLLRDYDHIDLCLLHKMIKPDESHALENAYFVSTSARLWKPDAPSWYDVAEREDLAKYLLGDLNATQSMCIDLMKRATDRELELLQIEQKVADLVHKQSKHGVLIDEKSFHTFSRDLQDKYWRVTEKLKAELPIVAIPEDKLCYPPKKQFLKSGIPSVSIQRYVERHGFKVKSVSGGFAVKDHKGELVKTLPLTEPLSTSKRLEPKDQKGIKQYLMDTYGWEPTMWNYSKKTRKRTSPRLTDRVTKEPCPNLPREIKWVELLSEHLLLKSRLGYICGSMAENSMGIKKNLREDGRISADADTLGTPTGRYRHKIVVNTPRVTSRYGKEIRSLFTVPSGKKLVGWDASAIEACIEAHYIHPYDTVNAKALTEGSSEDGTDIHTLNWKRLGLRNRDEAKTFKYMLTYGAKPPKIKESLAVNMDVAHSWYDAYWETNVGLSIVNGMLTNVYREKGYIFGLDGRRLFVRSPHAILNVAFQSGAAQVMKIASILAYTRIKEQYGERAEAIIRMHDEEQWEVDEAIANEVGKIGVWSIKRAGEILKLRVPLNGEYKIGSNWAETH